jgi:hypothetical protein
LTQDVSSGSFAEVVAVVWKICRIDDRADRDDHKVVAAIARYAASDTR